jgi:signal transduction histidine kinase
MEGMSADLNNLLLLHQVEIVREQLLIELKRAQMNLQLRNTPYAKNANVIVDQVIELDKIISSCFECHHTASVSLRLDALKISIDDYKEALSRVLTLSSNARLLAREQDHAYRIGETIIAEVTNINDLAIRKLRAHTVRALNEGKRTKVMLYGILAMTPVLALLLSALFIRGFTSPVKTLIRAARRLEKGDLDYRIQGLTDEYGEVADSFNRMAHSLKQHLEHMQWAEQVVVLGELAGGLAHEIKNPLAGVKASIEVLSQDESITEENRDVLVKVAEQVRRMEALIKSFMSFARPPAPHFMTVNMHTVIDSTIMLAQRHPLFSPKREGRITITKEYDPEIPEVSIDPTQLQQVFMNLLLNAAEAMPNGGEITIRTAYDAERESLEIRVGDSGKGVDEAIREKLFQPFFTTKLKGTGLGLSISKRLVEQQGGSIRLENRPEGGSVFIILLPLPVTVEVPVL